MRYIGKTAAISSKHLEQINWTVPDLPPALPWKQARVLLLSHLPFLSRKTYAHTEPAALCHPNFHQHNLFAK